jgi:hypothetical protein
MATVLNVRYRTMVKAPRPDVNALSRSALIDGEPEWHDGNVLYAAAEKRILVAP